MMSTVKKKNFEKKEKDKWISLLIFHKGDEGVYVMVFSFSFFMYCHEVGMLTFERNASGNLFLNKISVELFCSLYIFFAFILSLSLFFWWMSCPAHFSDSWCLVWPLRLPKFAIWIRSSGHLLDCRSIRTRRKNK